MTKRTRVRQCQTQASNGSAGTVSGMSAATVGRNMPAVITLDDLTEMMAADDHHHRYEISEHDLV